MQKTSKSLYFFLPDSTTVRALGSNDNFIDPITTLFTDRTRKPYDSDSNSSPTLGTFNTRDHMSAGILAAATHTGIVLGILLLTVTILAIVLVLCLYKRKRLQQKPNIDASSYSTLCGGSDQQLQPQLLHTSLDDYSQIHLSPSTGQAEFISKTEAEKTTQLHNRSIVTDQPQHIDKSTVLDQPTCTVLKKKESMHCGKNNICDKERDCETDQNSVELRQPSEELYTAVKKVPKSKSGEEVPPIPPHTVEEMYAVVHKPKGIVPQNEEEAPPIPQIPPHTVEELYTAVQKNKM